MLLLHGLESESSSALGMSSRILLDVFLSNSECFFVIQWVGAFSLKTKDESKGGLLTYKVTETSRIEARKRRKEFNLGLIIDV